MDELAALRARMAALQSEADRLERATRAEPWHIRLWPSLSGPAWRRRRRWEELAGEVDDLGAAIEAAALTATPAAPGAAPG